MFPRRNLDTEKANILRQKNVPKKIPLDENLKDIKNSSNIYKGHSDKQAKFP